jgi:4-hydroxy-3-methylbut-2-en-1-yl diphosphate reductase
MLSAPVHHYEQRLQEMDIQIIADPGSGKDFGAVRKGDVVILPAFGASVQEMQLLNDKEAIMVDTTCPWVSKVSISSIH